MADFAVDRAIYLLGFNAAEDGSGATWSSSVDMANRSTVRDVAGDGFGSLSFDDWMTNTSISFTGYYVEIGGRHYGVFKSGSMGLIPYDSTIAGGALSLSGSTGTTLFSLSLETAANCFLTGTRIATPGGERPIETLQAGDLVLTAEGGAVPVLWVWQQEITNVFGLGDTRAPIRIEAHALGPGCPRRDLVVSADHAVLAEGYLVNAGAMVNGTSITAIPMARMPARFTYWHVETEAHVALMAENCPCESFIDYTPRSRFDNFTAYLATGGEDRVIVEMSLPRISARRLLPPALRCKLGIVAAA
ncbi:hypothetical protein HKCCSP123_03690 [Rhodobacterales bacterium HKCCSP123]|nr:hypothetical protein [Rhodobacterales bacterium HKCCSP123]